MTLSPSIPQAIMTRINPASLKASQLRHWAFLTGAASTGTKAELQAVLRDAVAKQRAVERKSRREKRLPTRIVSVDMGIRNLAFCAVDVMAGGEDGGRAKEGSGDDDGGGRRREPLVVRTWRRMDLLDLDSSHAPHPPSSSSALDSRSMQTKEDVEGEPGDEEKENPSKSTRSPPKPTKSSSSSSSIPKDTFTPSSLSRIAYHLTTTLLSLRPSVVVIERQRFRSGGGAAIQEWTVRVNMLESMIWACLETLRAERALEKSVVVAGRDECGGGRRRGEGGIAAEEEEAAASFPEVYAVNPARVGHFWMEGAAGVSLRPGEDFLSAATTMRTDEVQDSLHPSSPAAKDKDKKKTGKADKKAKVAIVKSWVRGQDHDVDLRFEGQAEEIASAFRLEGGRGAREVAGGKLDDLADCLLQGVAWARWEENKRVIMRSVLLEESDGGGGDADAGEIGREGAGA